MTLNDNVFVLLMGLFVASLGCQQKEISVLDEFKELNKTSVARTRACIMMYASRHDQQSPKSQEELVAFLKGGTVDRNLERIGVRPDEIDQVFISERDGQPLKVKWGVELDPDDPKPLAFETLGVDGVRLVAADVVLDVHNEQEYQDLWDGKYKAGSSQYEPIEIE